MAYHNPYGRLAEGGGKWLKCNFHVHNDAAPADKKPEALLGILSGYKAAGYDIIVNSEHHFYSDTAAPGAKAGVKTFNGQEYIGKDGIVLAGTKGFIEGSPQEAVDRCAAEGGFSIACHPNIGAGSQEPQEHLLLRKDILILKRLDGVEVMNGCLMRNAGTANDMGSGYAGDFWDEMLSCGNIAWAFGNDDYHTEPDMDLAWTGIYAKSDGFADVLASVREGCLYASSGPRLKRFAYDGNILEVEAEYGDADEPLVYRFIGAGGVVLSEKRGTAASLEAIPGESYIRVEAYGGGGARLYTQPLLNR
jgi:hypothetical protein